MDILSLTKKYESGGDYRIVSSGEGDPYGGPSCGAFQLSSYQGSVDAFKRFAYDQDYPYADLIPCGALAREDVDAFAATWHAAHDADSAEFARLQDTYIVAAYLDTAAERLEELGYHIGKHHPVMQAVTLSTAIQHGPGTAADIIACAGESLGHPNLSYIDAAGFDRALIPAIYDERARRYPPTAQRYADECADALEMLGGESH